MEKQIVFDIKYIEKFGNQILDVELSADSRSFNNHRVKWRLKGMDENEYFWSINYVNIVDLFEFYHVVKYECDKEILCGYLLGNRMNVIDKLVERMKYEYSLLEIENQQLKLMIQFQPGGEGYEEAKEHFHNVAKKQN